MNSILINEIWYSRFDSNFKKIYPQIKKKEYPRKQPKKDKRSFLQAYAEDELFDKEGADQYIADDLNLWIK